MQLSSEYLKFIIKNKRLEEISKKLIPILVTTPEGHTGLALISEDKSLTILNKKPAQHIIGAINTSADNIRVNDKTFYQTESKYLGKAYKVTPLGAYTSPYQTTYEEAFSLSLKNHIKYFPQKTTGASLLKANPTTAKVIDKTSYIKALHKYYSVFDLTEEDLSNPKIVNILIGCSFCDSCLINTSANEILVQNLIDNTKSIVRPLTEGSKLKQIAEISHSVLDSELSDSSKFLLEDAIALQLEIDKCFEPSEVLGDDYLKELNLFVSGLKFAFK